MLRYDVMITYFVNIVEVRVEQEVNAQHGVKNIRKLKTRQRLMLLPIEIEPFIL